MFKEVGIKIMVAAKVLFALSLIACLVGSICLFAEELSLLGIVTLLVGPFVSWLGSVCLYGYGRLIDNSEYLPILNGLDPAKFNSLTEWREKNKESSDEE